MRRSGKAKPVGLALAGALLAALLDKEVEAHGAGFRALGPNAMANRLLGIVRHEGLGVFVSAHAFEPLMHYLNIDLG